MNYSEVATSAKDKARDILRAQMAIRIQERVQKARDTFSSAIRHYAKVLVDWAKETKDKDEEATKRNERRAAFNNALEEVPGVNADEVKLAADAVAEERAETDKDREETAKADAKAHAEALESASKRISEARDDLAHANENLEKLQKGELKVSAEELNTLANTLIEEERAD